MEENNNRDEILIALDKLNENQVATNNAISELQHYIIEKDKAEEKEKKQAQQEAEEKAEAEAQETENQKKEAETKEAENNTKAEQETETYTELLQSTSDGIAVNNGLIAGQYVTDGILCGVLLLTILWNKLQ